MNKKQALSLIEKALDERLKDAKSFNDNALFVGYNPIEKIRGAMLIWVAVPFNGTDIFCQLRCPNATQIEQCGDISNIVIDKQYDHNDVITLRNYQENLCKLCFNIPTFDNIAQVVGVHDFVFSEKRKELEEINKKIEENKDILTGAQKDELSKKIEKLRREIGYILPDDTMAFITKWAMGNDVSDIKKIAKETFLRAAILAERHHKAPSDYISGIYTDFNRNEIDAYAVSVHNDFIKDQQTANGSKYRWIGGRKNTDAIMPKRPGEK
jgi:hypothetical protein